jgi:membrane-associated phospholipid phosphatase
LPATPPTIEHRELVAAVRRLDDGTAAWLARTDHGVLRPVLRGAARASDLLAPLVAIGAWAVRDRTARSRAAVVRGGVAAAIAAVAENLLLEPVTDRPRPDISRLPDGQRPRTTVSSTSFPSGHVGVATAFSLAAGRTVPRLGPWLVVSSVLTAYARLFTGRHYLSDVVAGVGLGGAAAAVVAATPLGRAADAAPSEALAAAAATAAAASEDG